MICVGLGGSPSIIRRYFRIFVTCYKFPCRIFLIPSTRSIQSLRTFCIYVLFAKTTAGWRWTLFFAANWTRFMRDGIPCESSVLLLWLCLPASFEFSIGSLLRNNCSDMIGVAKSGRRCPRSEYSRFQVSCTFSEAFKFVIKYHQDII